MKRLKRRLNRFYNRAKINNSRESWSNFRHERNQYTNEVKKCKLEFEMKMVDDLSSACLNSKTYFKLAKEVFCQKGNSSISPIQSETGSILFNDFGKACTFNYFFAKASYLDNSNAETPEISEPEDGIKIHYCTTNQRSIIDT